jgi:alanyl-tRNA synthetase
VEDTQKDQGRTIHVCRLEEGDPATLRSGAEVEATVDGERRSAIRRNHTATHLLHAALRQVSGSHVHQKGSLVEPSRLRFDVTHFSSFSREELERAERLVREHILANLPVETFEAAYEEALDLGAMALFGEKYGDRVRVVRIGDISTELCGGTHVSDTGEIGPFLVVGEGSVSAGVRRLEAVTAEGAQEIFRGQRDLLEQLSRLLKVPPESLGERIEKLLEENRQLRSKRKAAGPTQGSDAAVSRWPLGNAVLVSGTFPEVDGKELRELYDRYKKEGARVVVILFAPSGAKMQVLIGVTRALVEAGVDARQVLKAGAEILGARGGGRPELVQAGASGDPSAIPAALDAMREALETWVGREPPAHS